MSCGGAVGAETRLYRSAGNPKEALVVFHRENIKASPVIKQTTSDGQLSARLSRENTLKYIKLKRIKYIKTIRSIE